MDRAGELEGRLVKGANGCARVSADGDAAGQPQAERGGVRELSLPDQFAVDIKLGVDPGVPLPLAISGGPVTSNSKRSLWLQPGPARYSQRAGNRGPHSSARIAACHP